MVKLPCGICNACKMNRSQQWAIRCYHEAQMYEKSDRENSFITLTYRDENLPEHSSLVKADWQKFVKRLRTYESRQNKRAPRKFKYFHCGEYGGKTGRPHYHAILFGYNFDDRRYLHDSPAGGRLYQSETLDELWKNGFATIGDVTFASAAYVARYCMKKNGSTKDYNDLDIETGEIHPITPEYLTMSRGQEKGARGIGYSWYEMYKDETYRDDYVVIEGSKYRPPKYYDTLLEEEDPERYAEVKRKRLEYTAQNVHNLEDARLQAKEQILKTQLKSLKRSL